MMWLQLTVCVFLLAAAQGKLIAEPENENTLNEVPEEPKVPAVTKNAEEGDVKLKYGPDNTLGVAMFYHKGEWGTICDQKGFRPRGWASVFCRQLHGEGWEAVEMGHVRDHEEFKKMMPTLETLILGREKPNCFPHNTPTMKDCPYNDPDEFCQRGHEQDVWVKCAPVDPPEEGPCLQDGLLRLVDKNGVVNKKEGRAEMYINGKWGSICDSAGAHIFGWAVVFCKQLNGLTLHERYNQVKEITHVAKKPGFEDWETRDHKELPINLQVPSCIGKDTEALIDCGHDSQGGEATCSFVNPNNNKRIYKGHGWDTWIKC